MVVTAGATRYTGRVMSGAAKGILEAAMKLDPREREELIEELSASLDATDLGEYWEAEIKRRIEDVDSGRVKPVPADEVFDRLEQRFRGK
jgi:putative addiction module component (TIGR02574 family)